MRPHYIQQVELDAYAGDSLFTLTKQAQELAKDLTISGYVYFYFNEVIVKVNQQTDLNLLRRDWKHSIYLNTPSIGPFCEPVLDDALLIRLHSAKEEIARLREEFNARLEKEQAERNARFDELTKGIEFSFTSLEAANYFKEWRDNPKTDDKDTRFSDTPSRRSGLFQDPEIWWSDKKELDYHTACFDYAMRWGVAMVALAREKGTWPGAVARDASHLADTGMTGFQVSCSKKILKDLWFYGNTLTTAEKLGLIH